MPLKPARSLFEIPNNFSGLMFPEMSISRFLIVIPISLAIKLTTTFKHPAYPERIYSTGVGSESLPSKFSGSSTAILTGAPYPHIL